MLRIPSLRVLPAAAWLLLGACAKSEGESAPPSLPTPSAAPPAAAIPADWLGRWHGPEGTWLDIARAGAGYDVTISNLDGPLTFAASASAGGLVFERDGVTETLRATDGAGTGMKWLAGKTRCLTVKAGEGFCRG